MSDMKCPICQNNLHKINIIVSTCTNDKCKLWGSSISNLVLDALAQAKQDLECTRKALDVLLFTINRLENQNYKDCAWHLRLAIAKIEAAGIANKALEQITTLEQRVAK